MLCPRTAGSWRSFCSGVAGTGISTEANDTYIPTGWEDHKKAAYVRETAWADRQDAAERELAGRPNTRDTRDLDAAAGDIEAGDNCNVPDLHGGDFGPF